MEILLIFDVQMWDGKQNNPVLKLSFCFYPFSLFFSSLIPKSSWFQLRNNHVYQLQVNRLKDLQHELKFLCNIQENISCSFPFFNGQYVYNGKITQYKKNLTIFDFAHNIFVHAIYSKRSGTEWSLWCLITTAQCLTY